MEDIKPLVSVCMITYNHEKYIAQAIEGVLMQQSDFEIELIIADDCSPDNTTEIVNNFIQNHKNGKWIKYIKHKKNLGLMPNFSWALKKCRGKYIALCEGDDYWTDYSKLEKQVNFLEKNPEFSACTHQSEVIYEDKNKPSHLFKENVKDTLILEDLLKGREFHTASLIFKSEVIKKTPLPTTITSGDRALNFLVASYGKIYFMSDVTCVYRKSNKGISSWVTTDLLKRDLNIIPWISQIYPAFPKSRYKSFIYETAFKYPLKPSFWDVVSCFLLYVIYSFSFFPKNLKGVAKTFVKYLPGKIKVSLIK